MSHRPRDGVALIVEGLCPAVRSWGFPRRRVRAAPAGSPHTQVRAALALIVRVPTPCDKCEDARELPLTYLAASQREFSSECGNTPRKGVPTRLSDGVARGRGAAIVSCLLGGMALGSFPYKFSPPPARRDFRRGTPRAWRYPAAGLSHFFLPPCSAGSLLHRLPPRWCFHHD